MSSNDVAGSTLSVTQSVTLWTVFLPPLTDIKRYSPGGNPDFAADVRHAECMAIATSLGLSVVICTLDKTWRPMIAWLAVTMVMLVAYEYTMQSPGYSATLRQVKVN